jgi:predicted HD phosphohydrolase
VTPITPARDLDEVWDLYDRWGGDRYDEEVTQLDHALQTAALADAGDADEHLVAAGLLHDVGHLLALDGRAVHAQHESVGAAYLGALLPESVTAPILLHVQAKRYLCAVDGDYIASLSRGSQRSLLRQGGPMATPELRRFDAVAGADAAVRLRRWDDGGKSLQCDVPPIDSYHARVARICEALTEPN